MAVKEKKRMNTSGRMYTPFLDLHYNDKITIKRAMEIFEIKTGQAATALNVLTRWEYFEKKFNGVVNEFIRTEKTPTGGWEKIPRKKYTKKSQEPVTYTNTEPTLKIKKEETYLLIHPTGIEITGTRQQLINFLTNPI